MYACVCCSRLKLRFRTVLVHRDESSLYPWHPGCWQQCLHIIVKLCKHNYLNVRILNGTEKVFCCGLAFCYCCLQYLSWSVDQSFSSFSSLSDFVLRLTSQSEVLTPTRFNLCHLVTAFSLSLFSLPHLTLSLSPPPSPPPHGRDEESPTTTTPLSAIC